MHGLSFAIVICVFPVYITKWHEKGQNRRKQGQNALVALLPPARTSLTSRDQTAANALFSDI